MDKKIIAFDMDGTLTGGKDVPVTEENLNLLKNLKANGYLTVVISSGACKRIYNQLECFPIDIIGNYGLERTSVERDGRLYIEERHIVPTLSKEEAEKRVETFRQTNGFTDYKGLSFVHFLTGQIAIPLIGADKSITRQEKNDFDPNRAIRTAYYYDVCRAFPEFDVFTGGKTSYDLVPKGFDKFSALTRYCALHGSTVDEALFCGDEFFVGGNDFPIKENGVDYIEVDAPQNLTNLLKDAGINVEASQEAGFDEDLLEM